MFLIQSLEPDSSFFPRETQGVCQGGGKGMGSVLSSVGMSRILNLSLLR